jgi:hypothetical protein
LGKWYKRRHSGKPWKWIRRKYFSASHELCTFSSLGLTKKGNKLKVHKLFRAGKVPIIRHIKIKSSTNLFVREDEEYYSERCKILKNKSDKTKQACILLKEFKALDKTLLNLWNVGPAESNKKYHVRFLGGLLYPIFKKTTQ